jgi:choice-of-anchor C domain-containing protein
VLSSSAFAELVTNGSFETGPSVGSQGYTTLTATDSTSISGWTVSSGDIDYIGGSSPHWFAADGSASLDMNGSQQGTIDQTLTTVAGKQYTLSFYLGPNPDGQFGKFLLFDAISNGGSGTSDFGGQQSQFAQYNGETAPNTSWTQYSFIFTASTTSTLLQFQGAPASTPYGPALDNVSVLESPEPGAFLLFGAGLGGLAFWRRSQSKKSRAAKA